MAKHSKRLVIDASVARSSGGEDATFPTSKNCRDFLSAVLKICHHVVMTPDIQAEWNKHQSTFARRWRVQMVARKKIHILDNVTDDSLRVKVKRYAANDKDQAAMAKDCHLLEAAMATDQAIASLDEIARALFAAFSSNAPECQQIMWINPDKPEDERVLLWLQEGAKVEKQRQLGYKPED